MTTPAQPTLDLGGPPRSVAGSEPPAIAPIGKGGRGGSRRTRPGEPPPASYVAHDADIPLPTEAPPDDDDRFAPPPPDDPGPPAATVDPIGGH